MSTGSFCRFCQFSDPNRKTEDGKIRCKRFSRWVDPTNEDKCYIDRFYEMLNQIRKDAGL